MKFLLVPLLIIGMFTSFAAALLAVLFGIGTVDSIEDVRDLLLMTTDASQLPGDFILREDKLDSLYRQAEAYQARYEELHKELASREDSLSNEALHAAAIRDSLIFREAEVGLLEKSKADSMRAANIEGLTKYYNAMKPALAAETLQDDELDEADVALILSTLPAAKAGKIMGFMEPAYAARITKLMMEPTQ